MSVASACCVFVRSLEDISVEEESSKWEGDERDLIYAYWRH